MTALEQALAAAEEAGIRQQKIKVGDLHVNVARFGQRQPLLLLHGWPEFWFVWRPIIELLANEFELIAPDMRGCGDTGKPTPEPDATATADRHAQDMFGLMDALGFTQFGVVGGDLGAYVAQAMSHLAPERWTVHSIFARPIPASVTDTGNQATLSRSGISIFSNCLGPRSSWEVRVKHAAFTSNTSSTTGPATTRLCSSSSWTFMWTTS